MTKEPGTMFPLTNKSAEELRADRQPEFTQIDAWQKQGNNGKKSLEDHPI